MLKVGDKVRIASEEMLKNYNIKYEDENCIFLNPYMLEYCNMEAVIVSVEENSRFDETLYTLNIDHASWLWSKHMFDCFYIKKTNIEKIKDMDLDEMADFIWDLLRQHGEYADQIMNTDFLTYRKVKEWLNKEAK